MVKEIGDLSFSNADDANVPVCIFLMKNDEDSVWTLSADNYMPRKTEVLRGAYIAQADTREELVDLLIQYVLPLYKVAFMKIEKIISNHDDRLYYWKA